MMREKQSGTGKLHFNGIALTVEYEIEFQTDRHIKSGFGKIVGEVDPKYALEILSTNEVTLRSDDGPIYNVMFDKISGADIKSRLRFKVNGPPIG